MGRPRNVPYVLGSCPAPPETIELLERVKEDLKNSKPMTREQVRKQKISFIIGALGADSTIIREQIEAVLDRMEGV